MASNAATLRNRCEQIDFHARRVAEGSNGWKTYVVDEMDEVGYLWVDVAAQLIAVGPDTWRILGVDQRVRYALLRELRHAASGIRELPLHESPYIELVLADAASRGTDVVQVQDRLRALEVKMMGLLTEAETLRSSGVSPRAAQVFVLRYAQAQQEHEALADEMARLGSLLRLVGDAVNMAVT